MRLAREDLEDGVEDLFAGCGGDVDEDERAEVVSDDERGAVELDDELGLVASRLARSPTVRGLRARNAPGDVFEVEARRVRIRVDRCDGGRFRRLGQNIALKTGTWTSVPCATLYRTISACV
jgi:hypothetical protein